MEASSHRRRIAVVGGGVVGCAIAYELVRAGFDVTLIERDAVAAHASGRNAGNLNPLHGTPKTLLPLALEAFKIHAEVRAELTQLGAASYVTLPVERVHLGFDESDRQQLQETAAIFSATSGFSSTWMDANDLRRLEPRLSSDAKFAVLTTGGLTLVSYGFTSSLATAAVQLGATILNQAVLGMATSSGRVTGVRTRQGHIPCDGVVLATGPWVEETKYWLGIELEVQPVKGELLLLELRGEPPSYDFTWRSSCLYLRRNSEVWVGGTQAHTGFDCLPTAEAREILLDGASRILPAIRQARLLDHVAALRPVTPSNETIAMRAQGWENVYIANGGGFKGVLLSVAIARRIRSLLQVEGS
jgi:glycine oxidase